MKATLLSLALLTIIALSAGAQTYALYPSADTFASAMYSGSNYGAAGAIEVSGASGNPDGAFDAVMQFSLSGSTTGISVQSVTLQLNAMSMPGGGNGLFAGNASGQFEILWMQNSSWTEGNGKPNTASSDGGLTYATLPNYLGSSDENLGTFNYSGAAGLATYSLPLDSGLVGAITSGSTVSLEILPISSTMSYLFNSKDFTTSADYPLLTVVAVPEPASVTCCAVGLITIAGAYRYRRRKA